MHDTGLSDKVLEILIKGNSSSINKLSEILKADQDAVAIAVNDITNYEYSWLIIERTKGDTSVYINDRYLPDVKLFLKNGGFDKENKSLRKQREEDIYDKKLQRENLIASTEEARHAITNYKWTRRYSIISLIVSVVALLIAILK